MRGSKYRNRKVMYDGILFPSVKECQRYKDLKLCEKAGLIKDLKIQVPYELIPSQFEEDIVLKSGKTKRGRLIEKSCNYIADFVYFDVGANREVVEDTKGYKTKDYIIKRKLMLHVYGIRIVEV